MYFNFLKKNPDSTVVFRESLLGGCVGEFILRGRQLPTRKSAEDSSSSYSMLATGRPIIVRPWHL